MKIGVLILLFLTVASGQSPGTFTATGNLTSNRPFPRATLLPNGKVLITGSGSQVAGAELYDPSTGKFTSGGTECVDRIRNRRRDGRERERLFHQHPALCLQGGH